MANKFNSKMSSVKGPTPGNTGVRPKALSLQSTANWPGAPGPKGPSWKSGMKGFREIYEGAKQDKADDFNGQAGMSGAASGASMGATVGSVVPVIGTAIGAVVGGVAGLLAGGFGTPKDKGGGGAAPSGGGLPGMGGLLGLPF